jgi:hypothetical protein
MVDNSNSNKKFHRDIIVMGASGGVEALLKMTIFIVVHSGPGRPSTLPSLLHR